MSDWVHSNEPVPAGRWEWFGLPGHFILADQCVFHLATKVGPWLVSTVGDLQRPSKEIGAGRTHETMVFEAGDPCRSETCGCGIPVIDGYEVDANGYNSNAEAQRGHYEMCRKWAWRELADD